MGPRGRSTPPATCGCAPRTATRPSAPPTARRDHGRPRPDPDRHGHRRRDPQGVARHHPGRGVRRRPRGEALLRRPRDHQGARARSRRRPPTAASQLREVSSGSIQVESGFGQVTIGVRPGVPAWLDLSSKDGRVRNELDGDRAPDAVRADRRGACAHPVRRHHHPARPMSPGNQQKGTTHMTTPAIEVRGLRKSYGDKVVLDGVDLTVERGHRHRAARPERRRQDDDRAHPVARSCGPTAARHR